jgi:hypothetical protein
MTRLLATLAAIFAACQACTPVPPVTPLPDASDASALGEASPAPSTCAAACLEMQLLGCVVLPDCATVLQEDTTNHLIRNAQTAAPLTCADIVAAKSVSALNAIGQPCGPLVDQTPRVDALMDAAAGVMRAITGP